MLKVIVDKPVLIVLMGIFVGVGILSKLIVSITLKKMVKAASDMSKSAHPLMRLVRAKFEHACMASDKVQNIEVFAQKYLYEYKVLGIRLHRWQRLEIGCIWGCLMAAAAGVLAGYGVYGMTEETFRLGTTGLVESMLLFLLHKTTDEKYQLEMVKTYMVDYLENVCAHRLEKALRKEEKMRELPKPEIQPLPQPAPPEPVEIKAPEPVLEEKPLFQKKQEEKKEKTPVPKDLRIREILEEFLA